MNLGPGSAAVISSPWVLGLFALCATLVVIRLYQRIRWIHLSVRGRDPVRRFTGGTRSAVLARAGHRCEHHAFYRWRCSRTTNLEADHVHPHSRGGSTTLGNGQVLCRRHNSLKGARIPFTWELRRLATVRRAYFPPGVDPRVVRHAKAPTPTPKHPSRRQRPPTVATPGPATTSPPSGTEPVAPEDILAMWLAVYRIDLPPQQREDFLAHPAMDIITAYDRAVIEAELRQHQKLDALARALENLGRSTNSPTHDTSSGGHD